MSLRGGALSQQMWFQQLSTKYNKAVSIVHVRGSATAISSR